MNGIIFMKCKNSNFNVMMALRQRKVFKWILKKPCIMKIMHHPLLKNIQLLGSAFYTKSKPLHCCMALDAPALSIQEDRFVTLQTALLSPCPQSSTAHKCLCTLTCVHIHIQTRSWNVLSGVSWPTVISFMFQDPPEIPPFQEGLPKAQS